jgi:hypothetical protein
MKRVGILLAVLLVFCAATSTSAQERSWTQGPVSVVTAVKVMPGQDENYINFLGSTYKPLLEEQKKAGIILSYRVYDASPRNPDDADMYLVVTYPNMASFDGLNEKTEPLMKKVTGQNRAQAAAAGAQRSSMRTILGSEMIREVVLK